MGCKSHTSMHALTSLIGFRKPSALPSLPGSALPCPYWPAAVTMPLRAALAPRPDAQSSVSPPLIPVWQGHTRALSTPVDPHLATMKGTCLMQRMRSTPPAATSRPTRRLTARRPTGSPHVVHSAPHRLVLASPKDSRRAARAHPHLIAFFVCPASPVIQCVYAHHSDARATAGAHPVGMLGLRAGGGARIQQAAVRTSHGNAHGRPSSCGSQVGSV